MSFSNVPPLAHKLADMSGPACSNWVIRDRLLIGPHPSRLSTAPLSRNLAELLKEGVNVFAAAQEEISQGAPGSPTSGASSRRTAYGIRNVEPAKPYMEQVQDAVSRESFPLKDDPQFLHLSVPATPGATASDTQLKSFVETLIRCVLAGDKIYLHCSDGDSRAPYVAAALAGVLYEQSGGEALDAVLRFRRSRRGPPGSPPSHDQRMQVHRVLQDRGWIERCKSLQPREPGESLRPLAPEVSALLSQLRARLATRGARGIIGLQRAFRIMDDDGSQSLDVREFKKGMHDYGLRLNDDEMDSLFRAFDQDRNGRVSFEEFLRCIKGRMSKRRQALVNQAFDKLDKTGDGVVTMEDLAGTYDAESHPDVQAGKRSAEDVLGEFLDTFDVGTRDGTVTRDEFAKYYENVSASIDDDNYFQLMMWNAWRIGDKNSSPRPGYAAQRQSQPTGHYNPITGEYEKPRMQQRRFGSRPATASGASEAATPRSSPFETETSATSYERSSSAIGSSRAAADQPSQPRTPAPAPVAERRAAPRRAVNILEDIRERVKSRGPLGLAGFSSTLHATDTDNSGALSLFELDRALRAGGVELPDEEVSHVFAFFDHAQEGAISVNEFLVGLRGKMSALRKQTVRRAFQRLDRAGRGTIPFSVVSTAFNAAKHPDVVAGIKAEDTVLREFLDTCTVRDPEQGVTLQDFENYYANISASVDDDAAFDELVTSVWTPPAPSRMQRPQQAAAPFPARPQRPQASAAPRAEPRAPAGLPPASRHTVGPAHRSQLTDVLGVGSSYSKGGDDSSVSTLRQQFAGAHIRSSGSDAGAGGDDARVKQVLDHLRKQMASRGARGIAGIARSFKIMDDDGSHGLDAAEFKKAMRDFGVTTADSDLDLLFNHLDRDGQGTIDFDELLVTLRGKLNERRRRLVNQAYDKLDADGSGIVDIDDIRMTYNADRHPDVRAGKRTAEEVLQEFLDTFDVGTRDGKVTRDEFEQYYENVSASIDDDDYFQLMMWNAWELGDRRPSRHGWANTQSAAAAGDQQRPHGGAPWAEEESGPAQSPRRHGRATVGHADQLSGRGVASVLGGPKSPQQRLGTGHGRRHMSQDAPIHGAFPGAPVDKSPERPPRAAGAAVAAAASPPLSEQSADALADSALKRIKAVMESRGARGGIGLGRIFRSASTSGGTRVAAADFGDVMGHWGCSLAPQEARAVVAHLSRDGGRTIDYEDLLTKVKGDLSPARLALVNQAFDKLDKTGDGVVTLQDLAGTYDARKDKRVLEGRMTEDQVLAEFLRTFDVGVQDGTVTREEFTDYYRGVSASVDDDNYFRLMMWNAWDLGNTRRQLMRKKGWAAQA